MRKGENIMKNRFKELRLLHNFSQQYVADKLFVNQTAVSQWERGVTSPNHETLVKLSDMYGVSVDYLLGKSDVPTVQNSKIKNTELPSNCFPITRKKYPLLGEIACRNGY